MGLIFITWVVNEFYLEALADMSFYGCLDPPTFRKEDKEGGWEQEL